LYLLNNIWIPVTLLCSWRSISWISWYHETLVSCSWRPSDCSEKQVMWRILAFSHHV